MLLKAIFVFCACLAQGTNAGKQAHDGTKKKSTKKIAYGGVLNTLEPVPSNDTYLLKPVEFAVSFALKRYPDTVVKDKDNNVQQYDLTKCSQLKVVFTADGSRPHVMRMMSPETNRPELYPLVWGVIWRFNLQWPSIPGSVTHSFTVSEYWDGELYIYEHTFHEATNNIPKAPLPKESLGLPDHFAREGATPVHFFPEEQSVGSTEHILTTHSQSLTILADEEGSSSYPTEKTSDKSHCRSEDDDECDDAAPALPVNKYAPSNQKLASLSDQKTDKHGGTTSEDGLLSSDFCDKDSCDEGFSEGPRTFSILTFNIWNTNEVEGSGEDYAARIAHIGQQIKSSNADIIGFQEVRFEDGKGDFLGPNQVQHLATYLKDYQFVYQPAQIQPHTLPTRTEEGLAIFSRFQILDHDYLLLPRNKSDIADNHQRILLHAEILVPYLGAIHVFNTHLSLSHLARQTSVVKIWKHLHKYDGPVFLLGDFNAEKHNDEVRFLFGKKVLKKTSTSGFHDVWQLKYGYDNEGFTFSTLDDQLTKRIDFIFMRDESTLAFHDVYHLDDGKRKSKAASDHVGIMAEFLIKEDIP